MVAGSGGGSLSGCLADLGPVERRDTLERLRTLPGDLGLLGYRTVAPVMAALRVRRPLNMLNAKALAVAVIVEGGLRVVAGGDLLAGGASDLGIDYRVVT